MTVENHPPDSNEFIVHRFGAGAYEENLRVVPEGGLEPPCF